MTNVTMVEKKFLMAQEKSHRWEFQPVPHSDLVVAQSQVVKKRNNTGSPIGNVIPVANQATYGTSKSPHTKKYKG